MYSSRIADYVLVFMSIDDYFSLIYDVSKGENFAFHESFNTVMWYHFGQGLTLPSRNKFLRTCTGCKETSLNTNCSLNQPSSMLTYVMCGRHVCHTYVSQTCFD